ncbi:hypothetical protein JYU34_003947 [Plutella xylostella]|uniref:Uncharacterized protein n=1 Tax=Plutella xylostella TaxID=51655 RepID=A0ABQ7R1D2_PLUXY|nr:hypothetical protein JYU34_003947 [Plutella xylostella]
MIIFTEDIFPLELDEPSNSLNWSGRADPPRSLKCKQDCNYALFNQPPPPPPPPPPPGPSAPGPARLITRPGGPGFESTTCLVHPLLVQPKIDIQGLTIKA